ncbi:conserved hypothetical protein [Theileria orientalis strain Shintoku]|uniref:Uncharacterized protein n=1 Tax=Theileria orientalis strain Shintoku TaxID=869250 RepID=J4C8J9_THEOR|nr:conserved hypothetical protein [Theileria orientalis strain Shintoku]BAM40918.1 conserved hypothetical protein [Theileria orientalis strain Shintoku]|eukprot:XP_009691219.1 conserved hypothetical protein [Theileria orientalis strain Shintoku]
MFFLDLPVQKYCSNPHLLVALGILFSHQSSPEIA